MCFCTGSKGVTTNYNDPDLLLSSIVSNSKSKTQKSLKRKKFERSTITFSPIAEDQANHIEDPDITGLGRLEDGQGRKTNKKAKTNKKKTTKDVASSKNKVKTVGKKQVKRPVRISNREDSDKSTPDIVPNISSSSVFVPENVEDSLQNSSIILPETKSPKKTVVTKNNKSVETKRRTKEWAENQANKVDNNNSKAMTDFYDDNSSSKVTKSKKKINNKRKTEVVQDVVSNLTSEEQNTNQNGTQEVSSTSELVFKKPKEVKKVKKVVSNKSIRSSRSESVSNGVSPGPSTLKEIQKKVGKKQVKAPVQISNRGDFDKPTPDIVPNISSSPVFNRSVSNETDVFTEVHNVSRDVADTGE